MMDPTELGSGGWYANYAAVRRAIIYILQGIVELDGQRCRFEQLVTMLNVLAGVDGSDEVAQFSIDMVNNAFRSKTSRDYFANCREDILGDLTGFAHIRGGSYNDIGLFPTIVAAKKGRNEANNDEAVFAPDTLFRSRQSAVVIDEDIKAGLLKFLTKQKSESKRDKSQSRREEDEQA